MRRFGQEEIVIAKPVAEVAAFAGNPTTAPEWCDNVQSVQWWVEPPVRVGVRITFVGRLLGGTFAYVALVTEFVPNERLVMRSAFGPLTLQTTYTWRALTANSTRMTVRKQLVRAGRVRLRGPFAGFGLRWVMRENLQRLKMLVE